MAPVPKYRRAMRGTTRVARGPGTTQTRGTGGEGGGLSSPVGPGAGGGRVCPPPGGCTAHAPDRAPGARQVTPRGMAQGLKRRGSTSVVPPRAPEVTPTQSSAKKKKNMTSLESARRGGSEKGSFAMRLGKRIAQFQCQTFSAPDFIVTACQWSPFAKPPAMGNRCVSTPLRWQAKRGGDTTNAKKEEIFSDMGLSL